MVSSFFGWIWGLTSNRACIALIGAGPVTTEASLANPMSADFEMLKYRTSELPLQVAPSLLE